MHILRETQLSLKNLIKNSFNEAFFPSSINVSHAKGKISTHQCKKYFEILRSIWAIWYSQTCF